MVGEQHDPFAVQGFEFVQAGRIDLEIEMIEDTTDGMGNTLAQASKGGIEAGWIELR
jgi:hypothetical protein